MKNLIAENDFGYTKQVIALADIMVDEEKSVVDVANTWAVFPRHLQLATSIASEGLKNPIIVLADGDKYCFVASGGRIQFAVINNYTHIDAIVLTNEADVRTLMVKQAKTEEQYFDDQYINKWWKENSIIDTQASTITDLTDRITALENPPIPTPPPTKT